MKRTMLTLFFAGGLLAVPGVAAKHNASVEKVQTVLHDKGFYDGPVDGIMGPQTREALKKYQADAKIAPSGKLDARTAEHLGVPMPDPSVGSHFSGAGSDLKKGYGGAGKAIGSGTKSAGGEMKRGEITEGAKDFGVGIGKGVGRAAKGTGAAAMDTGRGVKDAFDGAETKKKK